VTRGLILGITRGQAVGRALSMLCEMVKGRPINYRLEDYNGGDNPSAPNCANMSYGGRTPTSDCIGLVLWASGVDRKQPGYKGSRGEWLNCASLLDDADGDQQFCRPITGAGAPMAGDWVLTRSHIAMLLRPDGEDHDPLVIDCSPRHGRRNAVGCGGFWSEACRVIRPLVYSGE
jgi:hypothetical protein